MRVRELPLTILDRPGMPLSQRIALALQQAIIEGRLALGDALPGSRTLSDILGVNRRTIVRALQELEAQGWVVMRPNSGTFVVDELPSGPSTGALPLCSPELRVGFDVPSLLKSISTTEADALLLGDGAPDPRMAPAEQLAKAYQRALRRNGPRLLEDRDPLGTPLLRESVAAWLLERHRLQVEVNRILITRGSRGALALVAGSLFRPGSLVAVENPGNRSAWELLRQVSNLELRPIPVDAEGMVPEAFEELLKKERIHLLVLTPRHQFPTSATLTKERKVAILKLAAAYRVAIIEDDYDGEYHFGNPRPEPLLSMDTTGQVIHIGSLSRLIAPGLKLGYIILPSPVVPILARVKRTREEQGDPVLEWALADLIRDGDLSRHLRKTRNAYRSRRDHLVAGLQDRLGTHLDVPVPDGGMGLWIRVKESVDPEKLVCAARLGGLILNPPSHYYLGGPEQSCFRMGFAQAEETELDEAIRRLEAACTMAIR